MCVKPEESGLQQCLQSIYHQSYQNIQVCICFRELDEYSKTIIEFYQEYYSTNTRFMKLESMENGFSQEMEAAVEAEGSILWFIEENTVFAYDYLKNLMSSFEDKRVAITYGKSITSDMGTEVQECKNFYQKKGITEISGNMSLGNPFVSSSTVLLRKSMILFEGEPWKKYRHKTNLFWDVYIEMLQNNYIVYQPEGVCYQKAPQELTSMDESYYLEKAQIVKKLVELYDLSKEVVKASYDAFVKEYAQDHGITVAKARRKLYKVINYGTLLSIRFKTKS